MNKTAYLSLGSNVGDREANLREAIKGLDQAGAVKRTSQFYETEPMEITRQPWFINCAVELETGLMPRQLLGVVLKIERAMGRRRSAANAKGPRKIDIDILLFGDTVMKTAALTLPHPALHQRRFVLIPLGDVAPEAIHPVFKRSIRDLRDALSPSAGAVRELTGEGH